MWSLLLVSNACIALVMVLNMFVIICQNVIFKCPAFNFCLLLTEKFFFSGEGLTSITSVVESGLRFPAPEELVGNHSIERPSNDFTEVLIFHCLNSSFYVRSIFSYYNSEYSIEYVIQRFKINFLSLH